MNVIVKRLSLVFVFIFFLVNLMFAQEIADFDDSIEIESYHLEEISSQLNTPYRMNFVLSGKYIAVTDINNVPSVHLIEVKESRNYEYIKGIGTEGRGPAEYLNPNVVIPDEEGRYFFIHDAGNMKFVKYNSELEPLADEEINIRPNGMPISIHFFKDQFISTGVIVGAKFNIIGLDGTIIRNVGEDIPLGTNVPPNALAQSWHSYSTFSPEKQRLAVFSRFSDFAEIYDVNTGEKIEEYVNPNFNIPDVRLEESGGTPRLLPGRSAKTTFLWATSTKESIYALYSGKSVQEEGNNFGMYILKFDWSLNLLETYKLDHQSFSILADPAGNLYSLQLYPAEPVMRFMFLQ